MNADMILVFALAAAALVLFMAERLPVALVAVMIMVALMVTGVLTPGEGLSGLSNRATVTIAAMFVLSEGVRRTGVLSRAGDLLSRAGRGGVSGTLAAAMGTVGLVSAFVNNTAAVAIFIPVVMSVAARLRISPSRLLMPVSFASMFGGACTLIGTSTNILVSEIALSHGLPRLRMFELAPVGLVFMALGFAYMLTVGRRLVPPRRPSEESGGGFELRKYLTDVVVQDECKLLGRPLGEDRELGGEDLEVIDVLRDGREVPGRIPRLEVLPGDILRVHGTAERIMRAVERAGLKLRGTADWRAGDLQQGEHVLVEAVVTPASPLVGKRIRKAHLAERYGAIPLAIQHRGAMRHERFGDVRIETGDGLLLAVDRDQLESLEHDRAVMLVNRVAETSRRSARAPLALAIVAGVVATAALGIVPVVVAALAGAVAMVLTRCLDLDEGLQAVRWDVILLLAGMIPLGLAMEKTGGAALLAHAVTGLLQTWGPRAVLAGILLFTMLLTSVLNNQATAVLLAPMVIELARQLGADPRPFLIAVTYGASLSFLTPVGYQTNTMVYGPGQYRFSDYLRVGSGLNLLLWVAGSLLIPLAWPLAG